MKSPSPAPDRLLLQSLDPLLLDAITGGLSPQTEALIGQVKAAATRNPKALDVSPSIKAIIRHAQVPVG